MLSYYKNSLQNNFDKAAKHYHLYAHTQKTIADKLSIHLPLLNKEAKILEIGCGTGFLTEHLIKNYSEQHLEITDLTSQMVMQCQMNMLPHKNINFYTQDGEQKLKKKFDFIVSNLCFQWFENIETAIENLYEALEPNGILLFSTLKENTFSKWYLSLQKAGYIINPPFSMRQINHTKLKNLEEFILKKNYNSSKEFLEYLKGTGIYSNTQTKISLKQMRKALSIFIEEYEGELEYEITFQMLQKA